MARDGIRAEENHGHRRPWQKRRLPADLVLYRRAFPVHHLGGPSLYVQSNSWAYPPVYMRMGFIHTRNKHKLGILRQESNAIGHIVIFSCTCCAASLPAGSPSICSKYRRNTAHKYIDFPFFFLLFSRGVTQPDIRWRLFSLRMSGPPKLSSAFVSSTSKHHSCFLSFRSLFPSFFISHLKS